MYEQGQHRASDRSVIFFVFLSCSTVLDYPAQAMFMMNKFTKQLTEMQWEAIEHCSKVLRPFADAQSFLEAGQFVSLSYMPSIVTALRHHLDDMISDPAEINAVREGAMLVRTDFYYLYFGIVVEGGGVSMQADGCMPESALLAALVDPRTKYLEGIGKKDFQKARELLTSRMIARQREIAKEQATKEAPAMKFAQTRSADERKQAERPEGHQGEGPREEQGSDDDKPAAGQSYLKRMLAKLRSRATGVGPEQKQIGGQGRAEHDSVHEAERASELAVFFSPRLCPAIEEAEDPLAWWKANAHRFPLIAHVARRVLATPATSSPSEGLLSRSGGMIVSTKRDKLPADRLAQMMFLRGSWATAEQYKRTTDQVKQAESILAQSSRIFVG